MFAEELEMRRHLSSVTLTNGVLTVIGTQGNDQISIRRGSATQLTVYLNGNLTNKPISKIHSIIINARLGDDLIGVNDTFGPVPFAILARGGGGKDSMFGGDLADTLIGGDGDDSLVGGLGSDSIEGNAGNDSIFCGSGNDTADGGADRDSILGDAGRDYIRGGAGNDVLEGGLGNDRIFG